MTNDGIWRVTLLTVALSAAVAILISAGTKQLEQRQYRLKIQVEVEYGEH